MIAQPQKMFFQDTVSVHRPSFYAERFQRFMCNTVFRKTSKSQNDLLSVILPLTCLSFNSLSVEKHDAMLYLLMFWCCLCLQWNHHHRRRAVQVVRACPGDCPWALHYQVPNPAAMRFLILDLSIIPTLPTLTMRLKLVRRREIVTKKNSISSNLDCTETKFLCIHFIIFQECTQADLTCSRACLP